ncbi:MAG TPA: DUF2961 domain-containing protein [bacterium]|nr:DUF2961 domain-containing protein [bacterium]
MELFQSGNGRQSRWVSFENPTGARGAAAQENKGAKGHAFDHLEQGETKTLLDVQGSGMVRRMWFTIGPRNPQILRGLRLEMWWDGAATPAVTVPFGDFFGFLMGAVPPPFENALFASPEAKSYVCYIPMPFRSAARITLTNDSPDRLAHLFYDIELTMDEQHGDDVLYFHSSWRRERMTKCGKDFQILPKVKGVGRFVGSHMGMMTNPILKGWWGEGEIKIYLDGDREFPSLVNTGTEDYISTGWGQGVFINRYHGSFVADGDKKRWTFYRYHVPDPVFFYEDCVVTMQQIGGTMKAEVAQMMREGKPIQPISLDSSDHREFYKFLEMQNVNLEDDSLPDGWVNFYREDDWCATAFFYLNKPENGLPALADYAERVAYISDKPEGAPQSNEAINV